MKPPLFRYSWESAKLMDLLSQHGDDSEHMDSTPRLTAALGLQDPWKAVWIRFEPGGAEIHFDVTCDAKPLGCLGCAAADQSIHDRSQRTWQHLHLFPFKAFLNAPLPRVKRNQCGKITQVELRWAR